MGVDKRSATGRKRLVKRRVKKLVRVKKMAKGPQKRAKQPHGLSDSMASESEETEDDSAGKAILLQMQMLMQNFHKADSDKKERRTSKKLRSAKKTFNAIVDKTFDAVNVKFTEELNGLKAAMTKIEAELRRKESQMDDIHADFTQNADQLRDELADRSAALTELKTKMTDSASNSKKLTDIRNKQQSLMASMLRDFEKACMKIHDKKDLDLSQAIHRIVQDEF